MKSEQLNKMQLEQIFFSNKQQQKAENSIFCIKGKSSKLLCQNQRCEKFGFICDDRNCDCRREHKGCLPILNDDLIQILKQKSISPKQIEENLTARIDKIIDQLSLFRDRVTLELAEKQFYFGLSETEQRLLNGIKIGKYEISGKQVAMIISDLRIEQRTQLNKVILEQSIQNIFKNLTNEISIAINQIQSEFLFFDPIPQQNIFYETNYLGFKSSKIIKNSEDIDKLLKFFQKERIRGIKVLYQASQHDFETTTFQQLCHQKGNTLTLVQTEYGKIIGGFTPLKWNKNSTGEHVSDSSKRSFIFSLTNNHKFVHQNYGAIRTTNGSSYGPFFGSGSGDNDLVIWNQANQNGKSYSNINTSYINGFYQKGERKSWTEFCGNPNGYTFSIKEWEVWELKF